MKIKEYFSAWHYWPIKHIKYSRVIHSVKTAFACLLGVAIEKYYNLPSGQWIPITIMVVMSAQTHFGGALRKSYMRLLGTVSGLVITVSVLWLFGNSIVAIFIATFIAGIIFTYIASSHGDINYAGTLGGVTVILTLTGQQVGIEIAIQRGCYIIVGIIIALLVSRIIFPIHARDRFRYHVATTLRNLQKLYTKTIQMEVQLGQREVDAKLEDIIVTDIATQPRLIDEAVAGSLTIAAKKLFFIEIVNSEHQLNRLINLIYCSLCEIESSEIVKEHLDVVKDFHAVIEDGLKHLADCMEYVAQPHTMGNLDEAIDNIAQLIEKAPKSAKTFKMITEYSFVFFIEQILKELENMRQLITKVNSKNDNSVI